MIGMGYMELTTLTLSNERDEFGISGLPEVEVVKVKNPITEDHTCLRAYMMPSLMRILRHNKNRDLPQKIFEVGYVIRNAKNTAITIVVEILCLLMISFWDTATMTQTSSSGT
jgi:phenylalanyl-tRNA synthetase beta chain